MAWHWPVKLLIPLHMAKWVPLRRILRVELFIEVVGVLCRKDSTNQILHVVPDIWQTIARVILSILSGSSLSLLLNYTNLRPVLSLIIRVILLTREVHLDLFGFRGCSLYEFLKRALSTLFVLGLGHLRVRSSLRSLIWISPLIQRQLLIELAEQIWTIWRLVQIRAGRIAWML